MSPVDELHQSLIETLGEYAELWPVDGATSDNYYEAYLWALVWSEAKQIFRSSRLVNSGTNNNDIKFRKSPGSYSKTSYTYAEIIDNINKRTAELHVGIKIQGRSSTWHEFDIVLLQARKNSTLEEDGPESGNVFLHVEAKFHKHNLDVGTARSLVGLQRDCPHIRPILASRTALSDTGVNLLRYYFGLNVPGVMPSDPQAETRLRRQVRRCLAQWYFEGI